MADLELIITADTSDIESKLSELSASFETSTDQILSQLESWTGASTSTAEALISNLGGAQSAFASSAQDVGAALSLQAEAAAKLASAQNNLASAEAAAGQAAAQLEVIEDSQTATSQGLIAASAGLAEANARVAQSQQLVLNAETESAAAANLLTQAHQNLIAQATAYANAQRISTEAIAVAGPAANNLANSYGSVEGALTGLQGIVGETAARFDQLIGKTSATAGAIGTVIPTSSDLAAAQNNLREAASNLNKVIGEQGVTLDTARNAIAAYQEANANVNATLAAIQAGASTATPAISELSSSITNTATAASTSAAKISSWADIQSNLVVATQRVIASQQELNALISAGNYSGIIAAEQEDADASEQLATAKEALRARIASLNSVIAEQKAILASGGSGYLDLINAEETLATASADLFSSQSLLKTVLESTASASDGAAGAFQGISSAQTSFTAINEKTTAGINGLFAALESIKSVSPLVASAFDLVSAGTTSGTNQTQIYTQAIDTVNNALKQFNVQLKTTAAGLELTTVASQQASNSIKTLGNSVQDSASKMTALGGMMAYIGGRGTALALGMGQLGFALGTLGRTAEAIAPIFQALFPVVIFILVAEAIQGLIDKFHKLQDEIRKTGVEFEDLAASQLKSADAAEVQNLKLEDEINKIEGRPTANRLAEALLEINVQTLNLNKSLRDAAEKVDELLEKGEIGIFRGAVTGDKRTTGFEDAIKASRKAYNDALDEQANAEIAFTIKASDENKKRVDDANAAVQEKLKNAIAAAKTEQDVLEKQKADEKKEPKFSIVSIAPGAVAPVQTKKTADDLAKVDDQYKPVLTQSQAYLASLVAANEQIQAHIKGIKDEIDGVKERNAEEARQREKTELDPQIKAIEQSLSAQTAATRKATDESFAIAKAGIKDQVEAAIEGGKSKAQADLDAIPLYKAAIEAHKAATIQNINDELVAYQSAIAEKQKFDIKDLRGPAQDAAITNNTAAIALSLQKANSETVDAEGKAQKELADLDSEGAKDRIAIAKALTQELIAAARQQTRDTIDDAKDASSEKIKSAKDGAEEELRAINESVDGIVAATNERLAILNTEQIAVDAAYENEKNALIAKQDANDAEAKANATNTALVAALAKENDKLAEAIKKVTTEENNFNTDSAKQRVDALTQSFKDQQAAITQLVTSATGDLNSFLTTIITTTGPTVRDAFGNTTTFIEREWGKMVLSLEKQFLDMIFKLIEQTALFKSITKAFDDVFKDIFEKLGLLKKPIPIPSVTGLPQPTVPQLPLPVPLPPPVGALPGGSQFPLPPGIVGGSAALPSLAGGPQAATETANTTAVTANTAALTANTAALSAANAGKLAGQTASSLPLTAGGAPTAIPGVIGAATPQVSDQGAQQVAQQIATNAKLAALYQQDQSTFTATQAQKTAATSIATTNQNTVAAAGQAAQKSTVIAGQAAQTTAVTGAKAAQTVQTVTAASTQTTAVAGSQGTQTAAIAAAKGAQVGIQASATSAGVAIQEAGDKQSRLSAAKTAAANVYKSVASIPVIGWILAPPAAAAAFAAVMAFKEGGLVQGEGTGTSDSIAARLSHGEFVVNAAAVSLPGNLQILETINKGGDVSSAVAQRAIAPDHIESAINQEKGGGSYLDSDIRGRMEKALHADFSNVRIHTDRTADTLSQQLGANAFTVGRDIFFRGGTYDTGSTKGHELIAHELIHTMQHGEAPRTALTVSNPSDPEERQAYKQSYDVVRTHEFMTAQKGALLSSDSMVLAHAKEMVLPANLSSGIQNIISNSSSSTTSLTKDNLSSSIHDSLSSVMKESSSLTSNITKNAANLEGAIESSSDGKSGPMIAGLQKADHTLPSGIKGQFEQLSGAVSTSTSSSNMALGVLRKSLGAMISSMPAQDRTLSSNIKNQFEHVSGALANTASNGNTALLVLHKSLGNMAVNSSGSEQRQILTGLSSRIASAASLTPSKEMGTKLSLLSAPVSHASTVVNNSNISQGGSTINLNWNAGDVHAMDGKGVGEALSRQPNEVAKVISGLVKRGSIDPRRFIR